MKYITLLQYLHAMRKQFLLYLSIGLLFASCEKNANSDNPGDVPVAPGDPVAATATIVIIGASTAAGTGATPIDSAWVNRLRLITTSNPRPLKYINLAVGGYTTYHGMPTGFNKSNRPASDTARNITKALSLHPSLVMITFPSNDIANGYTSSEVINNYSKMTSLLDSAKVPYILFGTQPRNLTDATKRTALQQVNREIKSKYTNRANDYFDQLATSSLTIKPELSFGDGIHVNNRGHYLIVQSILNHLVFQAVIANTNTAATAR
jgi:acyl-CoA thioesterase-1